MHEVVNYFHGNVRDVGSRSIRVKQRPHLIILESSAYTEEPLTNDNSFISKWDNLLGSLGLRKYGGSGENQFDQSYCSSDFAGGFLSYG